jgi:hypothetical protein
MTGCRIEARDLNDAWHSATVMDSDESKAFIQFDKSKAEEWIAFDSVRLRSTQPIISRTGGFVEGTKIFTSLYITPSTGIYLPDILVFLLLLLTFSIHLSSWISKKRKSHTTTSC